MFRRKVQPLDDLLNQFLRQEGLESPLLQKRIIAAWDTVIHTREVYQKSNSIRKDYKPSFTCQPLHDAIRLSQET